MPNKVTMISVGQIIKAKKGFDYQVIEIVNSRKVFVKFLDEFGAVVKGTACQAATGQLINPCGRYTYGVGYIGQGPYGSKGKDNKRFKCWQSMFERCYSERESSSSYRDVEVNPAWHCYQDFAKWFDSNYVEGWQLDKDIRVLGAREYGPETCTFVPRKINNLSTFKIGSQGKLNVGIYYCKRDDLYLSMRGKKQFKRLYDAILFQKESQESYYRSIYDMYKDSSIHPVVLQRILDYEYPYMIPHCLIEASPLGRHS